MSEDGCDGSAFRPSAAVLWRYLLSSKPARRSSGRMGKTQSVIGSRSGKASRSAHGLPGRRSEGLLAKGNGAIESGVRGQNSAGATNGKALHSVGRSE